MVKTANIRLPGGGRAGIYRNLEISKNVKIIIGAGIFIGTGRVALEGRYNGHAYIRERRAYNSADRRI